MAATAINELVLGLTAGSAIAQFQPVQATGAAAVAAGNAVGFATAAAASGARVPVAALGTAIAISGGAIAVGAALEVHTTVTQVVTRSAGITIGRALTAAAGAGEQIEVFLIPQ
jgi:hypothetical protein